MHTYMYAFWRAIPALAICLAVLVLTGMTQVARADETAAAPDAATAAVESFHDALIASMRDGPSLGFEGRRALLAPVVKESFDLPMMTRLIVGLRWDTMSDEERRSVVNAFGDWTIANYAGRFTDLGEEKFVTLGEEDGQRETKFVRTEFHTGDEIIQFNYRLARRTGTWRIFDIFLNGTVSEIATRRSEFAKILSTDGVSGLVARLNEKVEELRADA